MTLLEPLVRTELVEELTRRLAKRRMSAFSMLGEDSCRVHVEAAVDALERDIEAGKHDAMRPAVTAFVSTFLPEQLGYTDLRFFTRLLRERLLELIRQASTPVTTVVSGILVVPLVGIFDRVRAEFLTERLLDEVGRVRARVAILDISGVPVFDTDAAQLIIRLANSVRLLGAKVILVGMSPGNAQTIVGLGIDLGEIITCRALQDGLRRALAFERMKIVAT